MFVNKNKDSSSFVERKVQEYMSETVGIFRYDGKQADRRYDFDFI